MSTTEPHELFTEEFEDKLLEARDAILDDDPLGLSEEDIKYALIQFVKLISEYRED